MKICFIGDAGSAHIRKWCGYFISRGYGVSVVSFSNAQLEGAEVYSLDVAMDANGSDASKLKYLTCAGKLRKLVKQINPDILSVHYATSYGTVAALAGLKHYSLSVWGSDIFDFPGRSSLHREMLKYSLAHADRILSTSRAMAAETAKYTDKEIDITPFGVDTELFRPIPETADILGELPADTKPDGEKCAGTSDATKFGRAEACVNAIITDIDFTIATIKSLAPAYGLEYLLRAFAMVADRHPSWPLKLRIGGTGPLEAELRALAAELGIGDKVTWLGYISQKECAEEYAKADIAVFPSVEESFGVAALEAQSAGCPVIVSDAPGFKETAEPGSTGLMVPRKDAEKIARAIEKLYEDYELRQAMGKAGRAFVLENYEYNKCFENIEKILLNGAGGHHA